MKLKVFIDRPILACVISALILMAGIISLVQLPVEQFPDIAPPTINVGTTYTGANAETIQKSVITPLEQAINGVEDMIYMISSSTNTGSASITVYFKQGTDPDMAQVNVQNRISSALGLLPAEVTKVGVTTSKRQNGTLKVISLSATEGEYDDKFIDNYLNINVFPRLSRISGVGDVMMLGSEYSMRIWLNPEKMKQYALIPSDVLTVLNEQNIETPTGTLGEDMDNTFQYTLKYRGRYETAEEFGDIIIRSTVNGEVLRLKDIAKVELGSLSYGFKGELNGHPGVTFMVAQQAGSNANEIIQTIDKELKEMSKELPKGLRFTDLVSVKELLDASVANVLETLVEAIILVILVVYVFLQSMRSTIIPTISIIVSLIGTFAFLYVAGFSLNLLSLFALVLVIGTVVDDAIVVVEAVQAKFDEGYHSPYKATVDAMGSITSALITTSLVFMAVFIPVSFMGGTTGIFYTQFGLTMAVAVAISAINALTLSPALCALIMTPHATANENGKISFSSRFHQAFDASYRGLLGKYSYAVGKFVRKKWLTAGMVLLSLVALLLLVKTTKTGFIPEEDTGSIYINVATAPGSTLAETSRVMDEIDKRIQSAKQIHDYAKVSGYGVLGGQGSTNGIFFIRLKKWEERTGKEDHVKSVIQQLYTLTSDIKSANIMIFAQPMISGYGNSNGVEMYVQDKAGNPTEELKSYTQAFATALMKRPEVSLAYTTFDTKYPQYKVEVDPVQCKKHGVAPSEVLGVLSGYVGGSYASNLNLFSKLYRVMVQASPEYRMDENSLNSLYVRTSSGKMSPIGQYLKLTKVYGAMSLTRFNMFPAISLTVMPASGYSSGQAIEAIRQVAQDTLPNGYGYEFSGMSRDESSSGASVIMIFIICIILVYLILCALYESLFIPMAIMLSIPFGLAGSFLSAKIFGIENNIYMQVGLIMLIGLLAKTAILLTEYASERRRQGMSVYHAAMDAAKVRLRPILMTALSMIFGLIPLVYASGVSANGSRSLAVGTIGGMLIGTLSLLFIVPSLFIVFQKLEEKLMPRRVPESDEADTCE